MSSMHRIGIMQPYFFPYIGYFSLIDSVDHFIFFDSVQYVRKSWMGRNKLLNLDTGAPFYIRPGIIKPPYKASLTEVKLESNNEWKNKLLDQTLTYKNNTPFYFEIKDLLVKILEKNYQYLVQFNMESTKQICSELGLSTDIDKYSDYNFDFDKKPSAENWALEVSKRLNAEKYINAPGGKDFINREGFKKNNIKLGFINPNLIPYNQKNDEFIPRLSILDVLFFNGIDRTKRMIKQYSIDWIN